MKLVLILVEKFNKIINLKIRKILIRNPFAKTMGLYSKKWIKIINSWKIQWWKIISNFLNILTRFLWTNTSQLKLINFHYILKSLKFIILELELLFDLWKQRKICSTVWKRMSKTINGKEKLIILPKREHKLNRNKIKKITKSQNNQVAVFQKVLL